MSLFLTSIKPQIHILYVTGDEQISNGSKVTARKVRASKVTAKKRKPSVPHAALHEIEKIAKTSKVADLLNMVWKSFVLYNGYRS